MFLVTCNESFGYTHEQTLDSGMSVILGMLQEHGYILNKRSMALKNPESGDEDLEGEWVEITDFETGNIKRVKKVYSL